MRAGSFGDTACFSFHARKIVTCGEGGVVVSDKEGLMEKVRFLTCFGGRKVINKHTNTLEFTDLGFNYRLSDIAAAVGIQQMKKLDSFISLRRELADHYTRELKGVEGILPPYVDSNARHVFQSFVCLVDDDVDRDSLIHSLREVGVESQIGTYACHTQPVYKSDAVCPNSKRLFEKSIALPMYSQLTFRDVDFIVDKINVILNGV